MNSASPRRIIGALALSIALVVGVAACSSGSKNDSAATTTAAPAPAPSTSGVKPVSTLTKADVIQLQEWLDTVGCDVGNNDGVIGPLTIASIKAFQKGAGLNVDGTYGPKTKAALSADAQAKKKVCTLPTPTPAPVGPTGATAACTTAAITTGVSAGLGQGTTAKLDGFGCDAGWAYAYATITAAAGSDAPSIGVTEVLAARDGKWVAQDRGVVCQAGKMPSDIYNGGCLSN